MQAFVEGYDDGAQQKEKYIGMELLKKRKFLSCLLAFALIGFLAVYFVGESLAVILSAVNVVGTLPGNLVGLEE